MVFRGKIDQEKKRIFSTSINESIIIRAIDLDSLGSEHDEIGLDWIGLDWIGLD